MTCRALHCSNTKLIEAHIIPKGFGRLIRKGTGPNIKLQAHRVREANPQLGDYDSGILCAECDSFLGKNDDYAVDVCREFAKKISQPTNYLFQDLRAAISILAE